jgi:hypothetical protein
MHYLINVKSWFKAVHAERTIKILSPFYFYLNHFITRQRMACRWLDDSTYSAKMHYSKPARLSIAGAALHKLLSPLYSGGV